MGGLSEEWNAAAARLEALPRAERTRSKDFGVLYRVALEEGPRLLCKRFGLDPERARDLAADLVVVKLHELVDAGEPYFGYFVTSVVNKGKDWLKKKSSAVEAEPANERADESGDGADAGMEARERDEQVRAALRTLRDRDQQLLRADAGEDRQALAELLGIKKNSVEQAIIRARIRLKEALMKAGIE